MEKVVQCELVQVNNDVSCTSTTASVGRVGRQVELDDDEAAALRGELERLVRKWVEENGKDRGKLRSVGIELGYPVAVASQNVERIINNPSARVGRDLGRRIYKVLKVDRADYLRRLRSSAVSEQVGRVLQVGASLGKSSAESLRVAQSLAAYQGELTDEAIKALFDPPPKAHKAVASTSVESGDELGGLPKGNQKKRR